MNDSIVFDCFSAAYLACAENEDYLGILDAVAGDGDHGRGMVRGFLAATNVLRDASGPPSTLIASAGSTFADAAGGASGALWGVMLQAIASSLDGSSISDVDIVKAMTSGLEMLKVTGKTQRGDKTLVDVLEPFLDSMEKLVTNGIPFVIAWSESLVVGNDALGETAKMSARRGRAAVLGDKSIGSVDAGAQSLQLILVAVSKVLAADAEG